MAGCWLLMMTRFLTPRPLSSTLAPSPTHSPTHACTASAPLLQVADDQQRLRLLAAIRPHLASLRKYTYGKHIVARVEGMLAQQAQQEPQQQAAAPPPQQQQPAASAPLPASAPGEGPPEAAAGSEGLEGGKRGVQAAEPAGPVEEVEGQVAAEPTTAQ